MHQKAYFQNLKTEKQHWWFRGRRAVIESVISNLSLPKKAKILEVGCGTGGNLGMLCHHGEVTAIDNSATALKLLDQQGLPVQNFLGSLPNKLPDLNEKFDLICLFDVLEHVEEDLESLKRLKLLLTPNGKLLLTVPAYQWLWTKMDDFLYHKRRYTKTSLKQLIIKSQLRVLKLSYFNCLLFPIAVLTRLKDKCSKTSMSGLEIPQRFLNVMLFMIFKFEKYLLNYLNFPFGLSIIALLKTEDLA